MTAKVNQNTTSKLETRLLASHETLATIVVGNVEGFHFRFLPNGRLHSIRMKDEILVNLLLGCPLAGGLQRLDVELNQSGENEVIALMGAGAMSTFRAQDQRASWHMIAKGLEMVASLQVDSVLRKWYLQVEVQNGRGKDLQFRVFHGLDVGLTTPFAARINEAYTSQYIDHRELRHPLYGAVVASRQNQPVYGKHPFLIQACLEGCSEFLTDARSLFGGPSERSQVVPLALRQEQPLAGIKQGESSYVGLRSKRFSLPAQQSALVRFIGVFVENHLEPSSEKCLELLEGDWGLSTELQPLRVGDSGVTLSIFDQPQVLHGTIISQPELLEYFPGPWSCVERSATGELYSFFAGEDRRHIVTRAKEMAAVRPHATILRSGAGFYPDRDQMTTTCFAYGVFNSLLSQGHCSFHRLFSYPRESMGLIASAGQRIWIRDQDSWVLLGTPSFFEMGLSSARWVYNWPTQVLDIRVTMSSAVMDHGPQGCRLEARVIKGPAIEFLITHGLAGGMNEYDERAELEIDAARAVATIRASADSPYRKMNPTAEFQLAMEDPRQVASLSGAEALEGGDPTHAMLVVQTHPVERFALHIHAVSGSSTTNVASDRNWAEVASGISMQAESESITRLNQIFPWLVQNGVIHFSVPHGIEQYNGGAWGTRDVTQGSVELLLALGKTDVCRQVLIDVFSRQYDDGHQWPQWFMLPPFEHIQQQHSHGDIPLWPLKALCDYVEMSGDFGILDEQVPWSVYGNAIVSGRVSSIRDHVEDTLAWLKRHCRPGTALIRYLDGDWDDSLQPARPEFRDRLVSSWTVALSYQVLRRLEELGRRCGKPFAGVEGFADEVNRDFHRFLLIDDVVCGFFLFDEGDTITGHPLIHPADLWTGIHYRLIPMTRSMLAGLFTPGEKENHLHLIAGKLLAADGARLMDRPPTYKGGRCEIFQRAESSSCFSREIGLMYVHAHLRYMEALIHVGRAQEMLAALNQINPAGLAASVPNALPRQANSYFSSSDAKVSTRYEAYDRYADIQQGTIPVEGGWRIYSSGPGILVNLMLTRMAGLRRYYDHVLLDPVLPRSVDGLEMVLPWAGKSLKIKFSVKDREHTPKRAILNGTALVPVAQSINPYRSGGWLIEAGLFNSLLGEGDNLLEVFL